MGGGERGFKGLVTYHFSKATDMAQPAAKSGYANTDGFS